MHEDPATVDWLQAARRWYANRHAPERGEPESLAVGYEAADPRMQFTLWHDGSAEDARQEGITP
ncbi:MAG TPA: hypothetical protein VNO84_08325 [Burkholderiaceae bacterium]|nr:hypothetical protein [Burkholderiaceae bacterium]